MAYKIPNSNGLWSVAATWDSVTNTPTIHASTNVTITNSNKFTATFTAPNITNACTGALIYCAAVGTQDWTLTLQENSVDTAATVTITAAQRKANSWMYFRFTTPYVFTSTTAGYYRFKLRTSSAGTGTAAADSGGSNIAYLATDNRTGVPAATDYAFIIGQNQSTNITVTIDGTQTIGNGGDTSTLGATGSMRTITAGLMIDNNGILEWDTSASATLTILGHFLINQGTWRMDDGSGGAYPSSYIATLILNQNGTDLNYGIAAYDGCAIELHGQPKSSSTLFKTKLSSGVGTAASPAIMSDAVDWDVGDEIMIGATSNNATNYNESEKRYIITKNSATSYVWSTSKGGAEAALTYTHSTDAWVLNVERNVIIKTNNTSQGYYSQIANNTANAIDIDWVEFNTLGGTGLFAKSALWLETQSTSKVEVDYCTLRNKRGRGISFLNSIQTETFDGLIDFDGGNSGSTTGGIEFNGSTNKTLTNSFCINNNACGLVLNGCAGNTITNFYGISNNKNNPGNPSAGIYITNIQKTTFINCELHANRARNISLDGTAKIDFQGLLCGTKGSSTSDVEVISGSFNEILFNNSYFGSTTLVTAYSGGTIGSEIKFHAMDGIANKHRWYTNFGYAQSCGNGLTDTNVRTPNSLGVRLTPENLTSGFTWEFYIISPANTNPTFFGYFQKNAAFGTDVVTVELWLPNSTSADASFTLADNTNWQTFCLSAPYSGSTDSLAKIKIVAKSATAGAYLYCDDFFNSGNTVLNVDPITGLDTWYNGQPISIITPSTVSGVLNAVPTAVWEAPVIDHDSSGTFGELEQKIEKKVDDNQALIIAT